MQNKLGAWARAAAAWHDWQGGKLVRFGDKARQEGRPVAIVSTPGSGSRFTLDLLGVGEAVPVHDSADSLARDGDQASSA